MVCLRACVPEIKREETRRATMSTIHSGYTRGHDKPLSVPKQSPVQLVSGAQNLITSATLSMNEAIAKRRATGQETIHLGFGEASFPLHPLLATALAEAAKNTAYAPVLGIPKLRQAIAEYLKRK